MTSISEFGAGSFLDPVVTAGAITFLLVCAKLQAFPTGECIGGILKGTLRSMAELILDGAVKFLEWYSDDCF
ncbi:unnamed protein product [Allacma fusca]|uniref:Uncharacterized protein n=1 Tax=Allacma fusca TaxID=39272 RepID=A0A8J2LE64_9HEXA|nr:unnamed protein product [Allacma fusca]